MIQITALCCVKCDLCLSSKQFCRAAPAGPPSERPPLLLVLVFLFVLLVLPLVLLHPLQLARGDGLDITDGHRLYTHRADHPVLQQLQELRPAAVRYKCMQIGSNDRCSGCSCHSEFKGSANYNPTLERFDLVAGNLQLGHMVRSVGRMWKPVATQ